MKKYLLLISLVFAISFVYAASPVISNIQVTPQSGNVEIVYDLQADVQCQVIVLVSQDNGVNYDIYPTALSGHCGDNVQPGLGNEIIWHPASDNVEVGDQYKIKLIARDNPLDPTNPLGAEEVESLVYITGGTFNNGTADVTLSDYYMSKYEVTQAEYEAVMGSNPAHDYGVGNDYPVYYVTWYNAIEYCNARSLQEGLTPCYDTSDWSCDFTANGYRLPTEMEWMYAAKGGNQDPATGYNEYSGTNVESELTNYAWYSSNNSPSGSKEVGTKLPNQLGLYDMTGNVYEWCNDWYGSYSSSAQTNPTGPSSGSGRILRGGSWGVSASSCSVAYRGGVSPAFSFYVIGFRIVLGIPASEIQTVADPVISPAGGVFDEAQTITITCETDGAQIYYTLDGSDPDQTSSLYTQAFELTENTTVKARAYKDGWDASAVASADFVINIPGSAPEGFILVEGGTFNNGTADVTLSDFYMSKYEVTQAQYEAVMGSNPSSFSGTDKPVEMVTWYNAVEYCNARSTQEGLTPCYDISDWSCDFTANGYRLPTEMEWMYAAKGGNQEPATGYDQYSGTNVESELTNYAWYGSNNNPSGTKEVGTKLPNQLGLYDMSGNVYEWCNDWYGSYSSSAQTNPTGPSSGSIGIIRGGSWCFSASRCPVAHRFGIIPTDSSDDIGFRIVRKP